MLTIAALTANVKDDPDIHVELTKSADGVFYQGDINFGKYTVQVKNGTPELGWVPEARVQVSCTCPDFQYRWAYVLYKHGSLLNKENYVLEPPKERNPAMKIGCCKHAAKTLREILAREEHV